MHCTNCGQEMSDAIASAAEDGAYCWSCGGRLSSQGECQSQSCAHVGTKPGAAPTPPAGTTYCQTCGLSVTGDRAREAHNAAVTYCPACGVKLSTSGKCKNPNDLTNFGKVPTCG